MSVILALSFWCSFLSVASGQWSSTLAVETMRVSQSSFDYPFDGLSANKDDHGALFSLRLPLNMCVDEGCELITSEAFELSGL